MRAHPARELREARMAALAEADRSLPITFGLVGVQKAATTSLYSMLATHPEIAGGPEKEITYFIDESVDWSRPDYSDYRRPAKGAELVAGDATPAYLFWPHALERMQAYDGSMRLMAIFRDPIERAFSQWSMEKARRSGFPDLPDAIDRFAGMAFPTELPDDGRHRWFRRRTLFARGLYGAQLARGYSLFPREQWLLLEMKALMRDHVAALDAATDFLGVSRFARHPRLVHSNASPEVFTGPAPSVEQVERLVDYYADDLAGFVTMSGLDASGWPTHQVLSGSLPVADLHARLVGKLGLG